VRWLHGQGLRARRPARGKGSRAAGAGGARPRMGAPSARRWFPLSLGLVSTVQAVPVTRAPAAPALAATGAGAELRCVGSRRVTGYSCLTGFHENDDFMQIAFGS